MPTYEYECGSCGLHFEKQQSIKDEPLKECPECKGKIQRLVSGGGGFILKSQSQRLRDSRKRCSLEETGKTCCGASQRCGQAPCGD
ncbi:MAG: zinc ribbon domain-containing protein [Smithellaceae bacterium]|jgi:putative FmdB family regulatory protein|nr:zinc ribbon domain-containing protein [Smithellaceae bacterium]